MNIASCSALALATTLSPFAAWAAPAPPPASTGQRVPIDTARLPDIVLAAKV